MLLDYPISVAQQMGSAQSDPDYSLQRQLYIGFVNVKKVLDER
jgi:hypothetical protein